MVDFNKKLGKKRTIKTDPIEIYDFLDRISETGPLRPSQSKILSEWFIDRKEDSDVIVKMNTGEGKTLVGLLILMSKLNQSSSPSLYLCPNNYLVDQVTQEANKFGIPICSIGSDNQIPEDYTNGKKILITTVQKLFNGKTIFGLDNNSIPVGSLVIDDSHACIDAIRNSSTIKIPKNEELYNDIVALFIEDLKNQGEGTFLDIFNGEYDALLHIPYWSMHEKHIDLLKLLLNCKEKEFIKFNWDLIKDNLTNYQAFINGNRIEISPYSIPISRFKTFTNASHKVFMSATTQDDVFFIKEFGLPVEAINRPLIDPDKLWSGEKMILFPTVIDESLERISIIDKLSKINYEKFGAIALTSSFKAAETYRNKGAIIAKNDDIISLIKDRKEKKLSNLLVLVNRYDGIDLPDDSCRILIFDSLPYVDELVYRYEEHCRASSDMTKKKIAQRIEQGLGRGVRGETDYCVILILGHDLTYFLRSKNTMKYFSDQTIGQIGIGSKIIELAREEISEENNPTESLFSLIRQSTRRDEGWKEFYIERMNIITPTNKSYNFYDILVQEKEAEEFYRQGLYEKACSKVQSIINNISDDAEKGWYLQTLARYKYSLSRVDSVAIQNSAFIKNNNLLKPKEGLNYSKINFINENRILRIKKLLSSYLDFNELSLSIDSILEDCTFKRDSEKFERAVQKIGEILGFQSQRPDKEFGKGPDNLWCVDKNKYFLIECKNEIKNDRDEITKHESGQMNNHCAWFEEKYVSGDCTNIMIIPTKDLSNQGSFVKPVKIIRAGKLRELKYAIKAFINEFRQFKLDDISDQKISEILRTHKLNPDNIIISFTEDYYHKT